MKTYKCVKAWQRHGLGTTINEWEYTKLPINIKAGHFQEITSTDVAPLPSTSIPVPQTIVWTDAPSISVTTTASNELTIASSPTDLQITTAAPLTTFSSGNKFKDKIRSKGEDDIRPTE